MLTAAALVAFFCGMLPARAADQQLLNLVMPDAKVVAGVNVDQAKASPFGQYLVSQAQSQPQQGVQTLETLTGLDPTRDVSELLMASDASGTQGTRQGLVLARGTFAPATITAAATAAGAVTEAYGGLTIIEGPKGQGAIAFLIPGYVAIGDIANVKGAVDRLKSPSVLPGSLSAQISQLSTTQDAWVISTVPPSTLKPPAAAANIPGLGANGGNAFQNIVSAAAGVKFGTNVVVTVQAEADNAQDAGTAAGVLQLLANLAKAQAAQNAQVAALVQGLGVTTQGSLITVTLTVPEDQLRQLQQWLKQHGTTARPERAIRKM
jgi:hypothetical protein